jgi:hypothetical protein
MSETSKGTLEAINEAIQQLASEKAAFEQRQASDRVRLDDKLNKLQEAITGLIAGTQQSYEMLRQVRPDVDNIAVVQADIQTVNRREVNLAAPIPATAPIFQVPAPPKTFMDWAAAAPPWVVRIFWTAVILGLVWAFFAWQGRPEANSQCLPSLQDRPVVQAFQERRADRLEASARPDTPQIGSAVTALIFVLQQLNANQTETLFEQAQDKWNQLFDTWIEHQTQVAAEGEISTTDQTENTDTDAVVVRQDRRNVLFPRLAQRLNR